MGCNVSSQSPSLDNYEDRATSSTPRSGGGFSRARGARPPAPPRGNGRKPANNCVLYWNSKYKTQTYHWWPLLASNENDTVNNLYANGGGIDKYDKLFKTGALEYQKKHHCILPDSDRSDKKWAGFCDRAAFLSCLYRYPVNSVVVKHKDTVIEFTQREVEALMIVVSNTAVRKSLSVFYGSRNNSKLKHSKKRSEPLPLELIEILNRFSKEDEPFVIDIDNSDAVWNYPFDEFLITREPIDLSDTKIPKTGKNIVYRFQIKSIAFPAKNIDIRGLVNCNNNHVHQEWLSSSNPDFLWKKYRNEYEWSGKSDINPHVDPEIVYKIYKRSICSSNNILTIN